MPDDVDSMPAGPELDALCATEVMGWHLDSLSGWWLDKDDVYAESGRRWHPSRGKGLNGPANAILCKALGDGYILNIGQTIGRGPFWATVGHVDDAIATPVHQNIALTLPLAICRAVVKAFHMKEDNG